MALQVNETSVCDLLVKCIVAMAIPMNSVINN